MPEERRWKSLDDACEDINKRRKLLQRETEPPPPRPEEATERWYSYTSNQNIGSGVSSQEESVQHRASDDEVGRTNNGYHYQKCRGGRRVIHKRIRGN